jgi:eukaryotic-like serine/threonine-protein kinase
MGDPPGRSGVLGARRFEQRGEIARGGMGVVYEVWDHLLQRRVAVKELWRESGAGEAGRFVEEARITGALDHPNVLPVHDLWFDGDDSAPRLVMKLVEGRTLSDLVHETAAPPAGAQLERLLDVVLRVCDALSFAHSRGVIHRDLHPRNVMVGTHGQVYVMDWGCAVRREELAVRAAAPLPGSFGSGTPAYMAPEQAWGRDHEIDERTDVFGVGAILYEILTLRPPFAGENLHDVIVLARRGRIVPPDEVAPGGALPARLCSIVMRALAPERGDRHPSVEALRADVDGFLRSGGWFAAQRFAQGALLLREGDVGDRAYIVTEGTCEVFRVVGNRTETLRVIGPGGVVGEIGLFTGSTRVANVRATTDVRVLVVTREALERELGRASWMRTFVEAAIARFVELDEVRRREAETG